MDSDTPRPQSAPKHTSESPKEKTQDLVCVYVIVLNVSLHVIVLNVSVCDSVNTSSMCVCDSVRRECERLRQHVECTCVCLRYIGVCVQVSTCAHNNRVIAPAILPWRLLCYLVYGRRHHNTCPIFPQSPPHGIAPEQHRVDVAG